MIIYISKALQDSMNIKEADIDRNAVQDEKYCWHAHITKLNGKNTIVLMNDYTTYSILLRNRLPRSKDKFIELLNEALYDGLMISGLDFEDYLLNGGDIVLSRNHDRQMLGNINEVSYAASYAWDLWDDDETLQVESTLFANRGIRKKGKNPIWPDAEVKKLLKLEGE